MLESFNFSSIISGQIIELIAALCFIVAAFVAKQLLSR